MEGRLITHFAVNLWWNGYKAAKGGKPRPVWAHCVPIGLENRDCHHGRQIEGLYISALEQFVINRNRSSAERPNELLLVNINPRGELRKPDRNTVKRVFQSHRRRDSFYTVRGKMTPMKWLESASEFRFILCPFGHGLDTHRVTEVLLMGGIPVVRRSSITSCLDDSDNVIGNLTRGSLPVVIVNEWKDVTRERLIAEWQRISSVDPSKWDWKRLFIDHWLERLDNAPDKTAFDRLRGTQHSAGTEPSAASLQQQTSGGGGADSNVPKGSSSSTFGDAALAKPRPIADQPAPTQDSRPISAVVPTHGVLATRMVLN